MKLFTALPSPKTASY
uniref:Uncharacterized protein n=1 Tax=Arundo donax TaxID=35708 RepID=A0A0A8YHN5_ARUDO